MNNCTRETMSHWILKKHRCWDFSWNEMGAEDIKASLKFIINLTREKMKKQKREISLQKLINPVAAFSAFLTAAENVRDDWFVYLALFDEHSSENEGIFKFKSFE